MTLAQLKAFLTELQKNKELLNAIRVAATANEISEIASGFGYQFSGDDLKAASKENIAGVKIKKQDTSPSYSFGESGIDPNEKIIKVVTNDNSNHLCHCKSCSPWNVFFMSLIR